MAHAECTATCGNNEFNGKLRSIYSQENIINKYKDCYLSYLITKQTYQTNRRVKNNIENKNN